MAGKRAQNRSEKNQFQPKLHLLLYPIISLKKSSSRLDHNI